MKINVKQQQNMDGNGYNKKNINNNTIINKIGDLYHTYLNYINVFKHKKKNYLRLLNKLKYIK